ISFSPHRSRGISASNIHFHSNIAIAAPREEGTIEVLLEMDFLMKKETSMFVEARARPEIESRNSRWAIVVNFGGASAKQPVIYVRSKSSCVIRTFQNTTSLSPF
ncbi:hypothetical protein ALC62_09375, partial [Cyphomyrmex costatus]